VLIIAGHKRRQLINAQYYDIFFVISHLLADREPEKAIFLLQAIKITYIAAGLIAVFLFCNTGAARDYHQVPGVMHVHSTYSSGRYSLEELVSEAKDKQIGALLLTDHDLVVMEYGLFPFRHLIKKRVERNSILKAGPEVFLSEIARLNTQQKSVTIIPGVQSSPFYYWTGNPFGQGLTAHDFRKELLLIGLSDPDDYYGLPQLHGGFSTRYVWALLPRFVIFLAVFLLSVYLLIQNDRYRIGGIIIALLSLALMINHHPFKSSRFDPYHGDQGTAPFQEVIDYVRSRGGLVFWAHPESNYSKDGVALGPITTETKHYPEALIESKDYTGFAAVYGDTSNADKPGMHWDQILSDYCRGLRDRLAWAIAGSDFHEEQTGFELDTFQTVFLVENKQISDILSALEHGRIYAVKKSHDGRLSLDQFKIKDPSTGETATMGEEIDIKVPPLVAGRISAADQGQQTVKISIFRDGKLSWTFDGQTPLEFQLLDEEGWRGKTYYRLDVKSKTGGYLLSNPIFVTRNSG